MLWVTLLVILGLFTGLISTIFGIGGGIIIVPMLYNLFPTLSPQTIINTSLCVIFINSILNCYNFKKKGKTPNLLLTLALSIGIAIGMAIGANVSINLQKDVLKIILAITLTIIAIKTLFKKSNSAKEDMNFKPIVSKSLLIKTSLFSILGGIIGGLTGLGGGIILVPLMIGLVNCPFSWIPVYTNPAMVAGTFTAIVTFMVNSNTSDISIPIIENFQWGNLNILIVLLIFSGTLITSPIGVKIGKKIPKNVTKYLFSSLVIFFVIRIIYKVIL